MTEDDARLPASDRDPEDVHTAAGAQVSAAERLHAFESRVANACADLATAMRDARNGLGDPLDAARLAQTAHDTISGERDATLRECVDAGLNPAELARRLGIGPTVVVLACSRRNR